MWKYTYPISPSIIKRKIINWLKKNERILIFVNLIFSMFLFEKYFIFDVNILNYFNYLHVCFKRNNYFYNKKNKGIFIKIRLKNNDKFDF